MVAFSLCSRSARLPNSPAAGLKRAACGRLSPAVHRRSHKTWPRPGRVATRPVRRAPSVVAAHQPRDLVPPLLALADGFLHKPKGEQTLLHSGRPDELLVGLGCVDLRPLQAKILFSS